MEAMKSGESKKAADNKEEKYAKEILKQTISMKAYDKLYLEKRISEKDLTHAN